MGFEADFFTGFETGEPNIHTDYWEGQYEDTTTSKSRTGSYSYYLNEGGKYAPQIPSGNTDYYFAIAVYWAFDNDTRIHINTDGTDLDLRPSGTSSPFNLDLHVGGSKVADGSISISETTWEHIQVHVIIADAGVVHVKVNGETDILYYGDTKQGGATELTEIRVKAESFQDAYIDDFFMGTGGWPGDARAQGFEPDGDTATDDSEKSTGADAYAVVDEVPASTGDYIYFDADGEELLMTTNYDLDGKTPFAINVITYPKKTTADSDELRAKISDGDNVSLGSYKALETSYESIYEVFNKTPGGNDWTDAEVDSVQIGYDAIVSGEVRVAQSIMEVAYRDSLNVLEYSGWEHAHAGYVITPWISLNLLEVTKYFKSITSFVESATSDISISVDYKTDPDASWTEAGTVTSTPTDEVTLYGSDYVTGKRIQFRFRFYSNDADVSVDMQGWLLESIPSIPQKISYTCSVRIEDNHLTLFGKRVYQSASAAYTALKNLIDQAAPVVLSTSEELLSAYDGNEVKLMGLSKSPVTTPKGKEVDVATLTFIDT